MSGTLDARQRRAVELEVTGVAVSDICRELQVTTSTLNRWREDPTYIGAVMTLCQKAFRRLLPAAISTLGRLLSSERDMVAFLAAKFILERAAIVTNSGDQAIESGAEPAFTLPDKQALPDATQWADAVYAANAVTTYAPVSHQTA